MNFENIIEKRKVNEGLHSLVLEISADEYKKDYEEYSDDIASNILQIIQKTGEMTGDHQM